MTAWGRECSTAAASLQEQNRGLGVGVWSLQKALQWGIPFPAHFSGLDLGHAHCEAVLSPQPSQDGVAGWVTKTVCKGYLHSLGRMSETPRK